MNFLRKHFGRQQNTQQPGSEDSDLTWFYTDTEQALQALERLASATNLPKRLLVIHGLGGVGKSTLLKMYVFFCRTHTIPVALVASEDAPSPVNVLANWAEELSHNKVTLPVFQNTLTNFRAIQAKVEAEATKSQLTTQLGKAAAQVVVGIASNAIPVFGPLVGAVGSASAEAFVDWLHGFLSKPDLELYLDPVKRLDSDFLSDLAGVASHKRVVLMVDTYEQMTVLDDWMRELTRRFPKNVLLVIAGRTVPDWDRTWQGWMGNTEIIELKEMTPDDLRTLVNRYYAFIRSGEPDPRQVEAIAQFARGLPMVATTVVQLWVKYGIEDFQTVRPQVVADLVDRLLEGVPQEIRPAFEAAAMVRYFNVDVLAALLENGDADKLYAELRQWPFVRPRREGLAVHDIMREMINEALRVRTPDRLRRLHERAAAYYEARLEKATGDERERYASERLYHRIRADEATGMRLFREIAEEFTRYGLVNQLRALLNDVNTYPLEQENSRLWREYYQARLKDLERSREETLLLYQEIADNPQAEDLLRAYALIDWAWIERNVDFSKLEGILERVRKLFLEPEALPEPDVKLGIYLIEMGELYKVAGKWEEALAYLARAHDLYNKINDFYWLAFTDNRIKYYFLERGAWKEALRFQERGLQEVAKLPGEQGTFVRSELLGGYATYWMWAGRLCKTEEQLREAVGNAERSERVEQYVYMLRDLGLGLGLQGKLQEAEEAFAKVTQLGQPHDAFFEVLKDVYRGIIALKWKGSEEAEPYLISHMPVYRQGSNRIWQFPSLLNMLGIVQEMKGDFNLAIQFYQERIDLRHLEHWYWHTGALSGLARIYAMQGNYANIVSTMQEADTLAEQYEYYDHLAVLRLVQGYVAWDGKLDTWGQGFDAAQHCYQQALINALRHNRFTLDEVLSGLEHGSPLQPVIAQCLKHAEEGKRMLQTLYGWWQSGTNDTGMSRTDTYSPIPEGISLLEGEKLARQQEPGDSSPQKSVLERLEEVLSG